MDLPSFELDNSLLQSHCILLEPGIVVVDEISALTPEVIKWLTVEASDLVKVVTVAVAMAMLSIEAAGSVRYLVTILNCGVVTVV